MSEVASTTAKPVGNETVAPRKPTRAIRNSSKRSSWAVVAGDGYLGKMLLAKVEGGKSVGEKFYTISVCDTEATQNADFMDGGIGYYKQENIMNACPSGFHPGEKRELGYLIGGSPTYGIYRNQGDYDSLIRNKGDYFEYGTIAA